MLKTALMVVQLVLGISIIVTVLLQQKGSGVGSVFGGEAVVYRSRRGVEKLLHYTTIVAAVLLVITSLVIVVQNFG